MKVSVIVPIYNSEKWIKRCVNSILDQTYKDIELILIDDGSQDNSFEICNELAKKDNRIKLIHIENQGVANARNVGLENSTGEFITFCDSDDTYEKDFIETLFDLFKASQSELCVSTVYVHQNNKKQIVELPFYGKSNDLSLILNTWFEFFWGALWNKLYISNIIKKNNIKFQTDLSLNEDSIFNLNYLKYVNSVNCSNKPIYNYIIENENSLTRSFNDKILITYEMVIGLLIELAKKNDCYNDKFIKYLKKYYAGFVQRMLFYIFNNNFDEIKKREVYKLLHSKKEVVEILSKSKSINNVIISTQPYFIIKIYFYLLKLKRKFFK